MSRGSKNGDNCENIEIAILAVCFKLKQLKKQPEKNSGLNGIRTHDFAILVQGAFFRNLFRISKENHLSKKVGITDHPSELNLCKVNATATIPSCE